MRKEHEWGLVESRRRVTARVRDRARNRLGIG
jgi:hypothetical protein